MQIKEAIPSDYDALVEFWNQNSGWDQISRNIYEDRFINAPFGPSVIFFIEKNNKILAKLVFVLLKVNLGKKEYSGCRPFALITDKSVRGIFGVKYATQLINHGIKAMRKKGMDLLIMLPNPGLKRPMRFIDVLLCDFPLFKLPIDNQNIASGYDNVSTEFIDFDNTGINELWNKVKEQNIYMVSRNQQILKWKNSHRDYKIIGIYQEDNLIGIATYLEKVHEKQIQICDVLIPEKKHHNLVFNQVSSFINTEYSNNADFNKMVILVPEIFKESLIDVGYKPDDYQFLFVIKRLNKKIPKKALNISNWYLSAND